MNQLKTFQFEGQNYRIVRPIKRKHRLANAIFNVLEWSAFLAINAAMSYGTYWLYSSGKLEQIVEVLR